MNLYEWLSVILGTLNLGSIIFLVVQIFQSQKQAKEMHEEQRRIHTLNVIETWSRSIKKETRIAEKIVEELSVEDCKKLYNYTPFFVKTSTHKKMCQMCPRYKTDCNDCKPSGNKYSIYGTQLTELRGHVTNYLNNLEIVAIAWQQGIVDRTIIESQFDFLYNPGTKSALQNYREVAGGGKSYPVLTAFYNKIKENNIVTVKNKKEQ